MYFENLEFVSYKIVIIHFSITCPQFGKLYYSWIQVKKSKSRTLSHHRKLYQSLLISSTSLQGSIKRESDLWFFFLIHTVSGQTTYTKIQMMGVSASCLSWNLCNVLLIQPIFTVCLTILIIGYSYIFVCFLCLCYNFMVLNL